MSPTLRSKLAGWICSSNIGIRATILPVEIRSWISWEGSTPAFTPRVEAASSGKRPCSEVRASRGILVLRLLAFHSLREASGALRQLELIKAGVAVEAAEATFALASTPYPSTLRYGLATIGTGVLIPQFEQRRFY